MPFIVYKADEDDEIDSLEDVLTRGSYYFYKYRYPFFISNKRNKLAYHIHDMKRNKNYLKGQKKEKSIRRIDISNPRFGNK